MKKITILMLAFLAASCIEKSDVRPGSPVDVDIDHYQTAGTYDVPVKEGCITVVKAYGVTLAEAESPMTIWVPRMTLTSPWRWGRRNPSNWDVSFTRAASVSSRG
mgnify:CR=1 FL=1